MDQHSKIVQVSGVLFSLLIGYSARVLLEFFAVIFGPVAKVYNIDLVRHGVPISVGVLCFCIVQFHPKIQKWLFDVVTEIAKVVWPTKKDTTSMTAVVCVVLILAGVVLGLIDLGAATVMRFIMN